MILIFFQYFLDILFLMKYNVTMSEYVRFSSGLKAVTGRRLAYPYFQSKGTKAHKKNKINPVSRFPVISIKTEQAMEGKYEKSQSQPQKQHAKLVFRSNFKEFNVNTKKVNEKFKNDVLLVLLKMCTSLLECIMLLEEDFEDLNFKEVSRAWRKFFHDFKNSLNKKSPGLSPPDQLNSDLREGSE
jgi:hypothetical protein